MVYQVGNFTSMTGWMQYANTVTENQFSNLILLGLFTLVFIYMKSDNSQPTMNCFMYASFLTSLSAIILFLNNMLPNQYVMFVYLAILFLSAIFAYFNDGR